MPPTATEAKPTPTIHLRYRLKSGTVIIGEQRWAAVTPAREAAENVWDPDHYEHISIFASDNIIDQYDGEWLIAYIAKSLGKKRRRK